LTVREKGTRWLLLHFFSPGAGNTKDMFFLTAEEKAKNLVTAIIMANCCQGLNTVMRINNICNLGHTDVCFNLKVSSDPYLFFGLIRCNCED
jgi:hypothetical protein